jgi:diadenosine tetraphosphate (Ap4A) HIT family hydrolase
LHDRSAVTQAGRQKPRPSTGRHRSTSSTLAFELLAQLIGTLLQIFRELFRRVVDVVHDVAEALKATLPTERVYLMSLGSHQGNAHVHWHVAPLPPDVPYERQQLHSVMAENGVLEVTPEQQAALAARIRSALRAQMKLSALHWSPTGPLIRSEPAMIGANPSGPVGPIADIVCQAYQQRHRCRIGQPLYEEGLQFLGFLSPTSWRPFNGLGHSAKLALQMRYR